MANDTAERPKTTLGVASYGTTKKTVNVYTDKIDVWKGSNTSYVALETTSINTLYVIKF